MCARPFQQSSPAEYMVLTREVFKLVEPEGKVSHLVHCPTTSNLAWVEGGKYVFLGKADDNSCQTIATLPQENDVSLLIFHQQQLVVGNEIEGLIFYDLSGVFSAQLKIDAGVVRCISWGHDIVLLDGLGQLQLVGPKLECSSLSMRYNLEDIVDVVVASDRIYVALQDGSVHSFDQESILWSRPMRGTIGERITGMGLTHKEDFFLTREGHALVAGEEEAIEFELWSNNDLIARSDLSMRLLTSCKEPRGALLGFDNGEVHRLQTDGTMELVLETQHPIFSIVHSGDNIAASSWFFIHGTDGNGNAWKVEHQGMALWLNIDEKQQHLFFAGDDQNDFTEPEPIGCIDLRGDPHELDSSELSIWFTSTLQDSVLTAEELYHGDDADVLELLTESERDSMNSQSSHSNDLEMLLDAMGDVGASKRDEHLDDSPEDEQLLETLNNPSESMLMEQEEDDLFEALSSTNDEVLKPQASAGDDQRLSADEDGTCIVLLNGNGTFDPHEQVKSWSWIEESGREIATTPQVRLKLPLGVHSFELRVVDEQGGWTSDRLTITIFQGSTS